MQLRTEALTRPCESMENMRHTSRRPVRPPGRDCAVSPNLEMPPPAVDMAVAGNSDGRRPRVAPNPTRDHIISAAAMLFADYGRDATTTEKVGQRAGVSPGMLFYYFSTKDELFSAVIEERSPLEVLRTELPQVLRAAKPGTAPQTLMAMGVQFVRACRTRNQVVRILLREFSTDDRVAQHFRLLWTYATELIGQYLRQELAPTMISLEDTAGMFVSHLMFAAAFDGVVDAEVFVTAAVDVLLRGRS
jgi:AcrR family transcriptional regulator